MERNYAIDFMKFFAIAFVVYIHVAAARTYAVSDPVDFLYMLDTFAKFAVPFFFTASGYFLGLKIAEKPGKTDAFFMKYAGRLIGLFASWAMFYYAVDVSASVLIGRALSVPDFTRIFFELRTYYYSTPGMSYQLWYLLASIWAMVILYVSVKKFKLPVHILLLGSLLLNLAGLFGQSYSVLAAYPGLETRDAVFFGLFYTTLGYWFSVYFPVLKPRLSRIPRSVYLILFFVFSLTSIAERTWLFDPAHFRGNENYYLSTIPLTICLFVFVLLNPNLGRGSKIARVGGNAVGIYVSHLFFMYVFLKIVERLHFEFLLQNVWWYLLFTPFVTAVSHLGYQALQFIKRNIRQSRVTKGEIRLPKPKRSNFT